MGRLNRWLSLHMRCIDNYYKIDIVGIGPKQGQMGFRSQVEHFG
jgi:hypothetical protein